MGDASAIFIITNGGRKRLGINFLIIIYLSWGLQETLMKIIIIVIRFYML